MSQLREADQYRPIVEMVEDMEALEEETTLVSASLKSILKRIAL